jgi:hypothetical protein
MTEVKRSGPDSPSKIDAKLNLAFKRLSNKNVISSGDVWQGQADDMMPASRAILISKMKKVPLFQEISEETLDIIA